MSGVPATVRIQVVAAATLQDLGRAAYGPLGVPTSGVWDRIGYTDLCALVDVPVGEWPVIEAWMGDVEWTCDASTAFAFCGPVELLINGRPGGSEDSACSAGAGAVVTFRRLGYGPVLVLVPGLIAPRILGSASADSFSGLGGGPLCAGDAFELEPSVQARAHARVGSFARPAPRHPGRLRFVSHDVADDLLSGREWTVADVSRSGVRLAAREDTSWPAPTWKSGPVCPGVIQLPADGHPIVLGPDAGTFGGYPIVGVVTPDSLADLAYGAPASAVRFVAVEPPVLDERPARTIVRMAGEPSPRRPGDG